MSAQGKLDDAEIIRRLAHDLASWTYAGGALRRTFRTYGWKGTLMAANAIGHLAEVAWHHPDLQLSYDKVVVILWSHDAGGVTARDIALAAQIEKVISWRPDQEGGPLSGTPHDEKNGYLKYD